VGQAIGDILPYAIGVAISPIPIIAVILMLFSNRARVNGPTFLLGWIIGLGIVVTVVYLASDSANVSTDSSASDSVSSIKIILGVILLLMAARQWRKRPAPGETAPMPKWTRAIDSFTPVKAFGVGVLLSGVNPKNLILSAGAAATVAQAGLSDTDAAVSLAVFVVIASLSIAVPVLFALLGGERARHVLDSWKAWLADNNATVMAVVLLVLGVAVIGKGVGGVSS
jgi:Sap, sulfolipid-1-addressing protein